MINIVKAAYCKVNNKFKTYPLNLQINITIGIIILLTVSSITAFTYFNTLNQIKNNFKDTGLLILQETMDKINSRFKLIENTIMMISNDSRIMNFGLDKDINENEINKYLNSCYEFNKYDTHQEGLAYVQNLIDDIIFINDSSIVIARRLHFTSYNIRSQLGNEWFKKAYKNKGKLIWTDCFINSSSQQLLGKDNDEFNSRLNNFMLIRYVVNEKNFEDVGYIAISVNLENLSKLIDNIKFGKNGNLYIINSAGGILASEDRSLILKKINFDDESMQKISDSSNDQIFFEGTIGQKKYFIYHAPLSINNWKLILTIPVKEMEDSVSSTLLSVLLIGMLSFIVVTAITTLVLNNMSHPLKKILMAIKETRDGNFSHKVDVQGCMEVNQLSTEFNFMLEKINSLLDKIVDEQKALRKSELKALRAQINPHFLYNTLDSIKWLIFSGDSAKASELASALSTFFRIGLSGGNEEIPIRDEVEHVKYYLFIQKLRCGDNMNYLIDMDPDVENLKTPNLILQPVVENAILHGLNRKEGTWLIKLIARKADSQTVVFEITDNGIGMTPEDLEKLNAQIKDPLIQRTAGNHGYAMRNVNQRIKLSYGDNYGIAYKSKYGVGTKVTITIPAINQK